MNFRNYNDLYFDVLRWSTRLPHNIDVVIGVPRSGMLVAFMLAQIRNIHLGSVESLISGKFEHGRSRRIYGEIPPRKILVVDDSFSSGKTMNAVRAKLARFKNVLYGVVYMGKGKGHLVDFYYQKMLNPRAFIWQIFHSDNLSGACVDIDGVLCLDPTGKQNDGDGPRYQKFLQTATPLILPTYLIHSLVTARLERWRAFTEQWLERHNVRYKNLIMSQCKTAKDRGNHTNHATEKALYYKKTKETFLFIESSWLQAQTIQQISGKAVLCSSTMCLV